MSISIKISGNTLHDNASVIRELNDYSGTDWDTLAEDVVRAKSSACTQDLVEALNGLEAAVRQRNAKSTSDVVRRFAAAFTSTMFGNIASTVLYAFVQSFLK